MRSELQQILLEKLREKGLKVLFGMSLDSVREEDGKVTARTRLYWISSVTKDGAEKL